MQLLFYSILFYSTSFIPVIKTFSSLHIAVGDAFLVQPIEAVGYLYDELFEHFDHLIFFPMAPQ